MLSLLKEIIPQRKTPNLTRPKIKDIKEQLLFGREFKKYDNLKKLVSTIIL
jgi:hypothetical protein